MDRHQQATVAEQVHDGALNVDEAVAFSRLSRAELYRLMDRGELPFVKYGRRRLIPKNAFRELLAKHVIAASVK